MMHMKNHLEIIAELTSHTGREEEPVNDQYKKYCRQNIRHAQEYKPAGSDETNDKTTFITLYGLDGAEKLAQQHNDAALDALAPLGPQADFLREMARELLQRKN